MHYLTNCLVHHLFILFKALFENEENNSDQVGFVSYLFDQMNLCTINIFCLVPEIADIIFK